MLILGGFIGKVCITFAGIRCDKCFRIARGMLAWVGDILYIYQTHPQHRPQFRPARALLSARPILAPHSMPSIKSPPSFYLCMR
jgi:hypothetical protein